MPTLVNHEDVEDLFSYHIVDADGRLRIDEFRQQFKNLAHNILNGLPSTPERTLVLRKLHDTMMQLNVAISQDYPTA